MKKLLLMTLLLFGAATTYATNVTANYSNGYCKNFIHVTVTGANASFYVQIKFGSSTGPNVYPFSPVFTQSTVFIQNAAVASHPVSVTYHVNVRHVGTNNLMAATTITIPPSCPYRTRKLMYYDQPQSNGRVVMPEDENEVDETDLQVKWKLEEIDPQTLEPVFTLDNPTGWSSANAPGASNAFNGFNGFDAASVANLQAGYTYADAGIFDPNKIYLVTRSTRETSGDDWVDYFMYLGPGLNTDEPEERSVLIETGEAADLFELAQDRDAGTVSFNTTVDAGEVLIFDMAGNRLDAITLSDETFQYELNVAGYARGMYIARLLSGSKLTVAKFAVE